MFESSSGGQIPGWCRRIRAVSSADLRRGLDRTRCACFAAALLFQPVRLPSSRPRSRVHRTFSRCSNPPRFSSSESKQRWDPRLRIPSFVSFVGPLGLEPRTSGLKVRCSAIELEAPAEEKTRPAVHIRLQRVHHTHFGLPSHILFRAALHAVKDRGVARGTHLPSPPGRALPAACPASGVPRQRRVLPRVWRAGTSDCRTATTWQPRSSRPPPG